MALVIESYPDQYSSVHGDLIYTVSETTKTADPVAYPNYKFIGDVYVGSTLVARIRKVQDPATGIGVFNIGQVVRNYIATTFEPTSSGLVAQQLGSGEFFLTITMKFGEEYNYESTYDITVDSARVFFNHYNMRLVGATSALAAYTNKFATRRPTTGQVLLTSAFNFIPYFPTSTSAVNITVTPNVGNVYNGSFTPSAANVLQVLNVSPVALNTLQAGTITAATRYYTVQIGSQSYRFYVICEAQHDVYPIHFLNKLGGFETKLFTKVSRRKYEVSKKDFGKLPYRVSSGGDVSFASSNGVYYESRSVYASQIVEKMELNTDLLPDAEYRWLEDLIFSPMVYMEDSGYFIPIVIKENNYEPKKVKQDELTNLTLSIEFGDRLNAQYR